ncbi:hypothetical protein ACP4OV_014521 [Aristida adscensionis]
MCYPFAVIFPCCCPDRLEECAGSFPDDLGEQINNYAMFTGYVSMAVRGLGYIVLTWTTVVLLGGFVSLLQKKDFWSLTVITLVQTTGVFSVSLKQKVSRLKDSSSGLLISMCYGEPGFWRASVVLIATLLQGLVVAVILLPLGAVYVFGLYISSGISLWRLIQHDYVEEEGDPSKANLKAALEVLYFLAVLQGVLFAYRAIISRRGKTVVLAKMYDRYKFDADAQRSVMDYVHETTAGCEKDPSFARGRSLVTYAMDLMESRSPGSHISGVRILDSLLVTDDRERTGQQQQQQQLRDRVMQLLLGSAASAAHVLWKLTQMVHPRSPYGEEARERATRILELLRLDLEQMQGGSQGLVWAMHRCSSGPVVIHYTTTASAPPPV